jgi:hypothetical protein
VRFDVESGAGEDEALILVSNGAVPADVDTAVHLDAKERAITDLPEECVVVEDLGCGGRAAERPPDEVFALASTWRMMISGFYSQNGRGPTPKCSR